MAYVYILAPHTNNNFAVFHHACTLFPDLINERQVGRATPKSENDVLDTDGALLVAQSIEQYIYVKANTQELEQSGLLSHVTDYQLFTIDTQPNNDFWLNVQ